MIKIYCDNNMLFHNIDRHKTEPKSAAELTALEKLMELRRSGKI
jgi:hypothetical protein